MYVLILDQLHYLLSPEYNVCFLCHGHTITLHERSMSNYFPIASGLMDYFVYIFVDNYTPRTSRLLWPIVTLYLNRFFLWLIIFYLIFLLVGSCINTITLYVNFMLFQANIYVSIAMFIPFPMSPRSCLEYILSM